MDKCCICQKEKNKNLIILGKPICDDCEWQILKANAHKSSYLKLSNNLKNIVYQK